MILGAGWCGFRSSAGCFSATFVSAGGVCEGCVCEGCVLTGCVSGSELGSGCTGGSAGMNASGSLSAGSFAPHCTQNRAPFSMLGAPQFKQWTNAASRDASFLIVHTRRRHPHPASASSLRPSSCLLSLPPSNHHSLSVRPTPNGMLKIPHVQR